jgi:hypothetical protein
MKFFLRRAATNRVRKRGAACSYGDKQCVEAIAGYRQAVLFENQDVRFYRFANILNRRFLCLALADTTRQTRAFRNPEPALAWINENLAHRLTSSSDPSDVQRK